MCVMSAHAHSPEDGSEMFTEKFRNNFHFHLRLSK